MNLERRVPGEAESRVGEELSGKWTLLRVLGVGGASAVYEAVHRNGRRAAVKILSGSNVDVSSRRIAAEEARLANTVAHPAVVEILDDDVADDGSAYLVMELLDGETLEDRRLRAGGRLALATALPIFERLLDVLAAAHEHGIVHRDIKPENVFLTADGRVKLLDFGLAARGRQTQDGTPWCGTPGFMPPEQARAEWTEVDARSDLWAAAAAFHTVLTGRLVHDALTSDALVFAAATEEVELSYLDRTAPPRVVDVLARALARDKTDRFPNARAMLAALMAAAKAPMLRRRPPSPPPPLPKCQSTTRILLLREQVTQRLGCPGAGGRGGRLCCVMCPVCSREQLSSYGCAG